MAIIKKYGAEVVSITSLHKGYYTVEFRSLSGKFRYESGQFLHLALDDYDPSAAWPESRCFSMQSAPSDDLLQISYAVKGVFTVQMEKELQVGKRVCLKMPFGDLFTQDHNKQQTVFIAGGTGITPYLSLFTDTSFAQYLSPILYAGFKTEAFNFYQAALAKAKQINPSLRINNVYEDIDGLMDIKQIVSECGVATCYFISGPPVMIKTFKKQLIEMGVSEHQIKTDDWE